MRQRERFVVISEQLTRKGYVAVVDLTGQTEASAATIRRDLEAMERQQLLTRTHGGAIAGTFADESPRHRSTGRNHHQKRRIAEAAAELVDESVQSVGFSGGTTTTALARLLPEGRPLKVVTNALNIASDLYVCPDIDLVVTGGVCQDSHGLVGPIAERALARISLDLVFLGVDGIDPEGGISTRDEVEASTDHFLMATTRRVVVVADGSKVGKRAFSRIAGLGEIDTLITDGTADKSVLELIRAAGVVVITV